MTHISCCCCCPRHGLQVAHPHVAHKQPPSGSKSLPLTSNASLITGSTSRRPPPGSSAAPTPPGRPMEARGGEDGPLGHRHTAGSCVARHR
eukprot:8346426-Pyramimonas_sp.AAC.1